MATLVLRTVKGTPLTNLEVDNNFSNILADIGSLTDLTTLSKSNVVSSINELKANIITISGIDANTTSSIGILSNLLTSANSNLVTAVNEVQLEVGELTGLSTTNKTNLVSAVNELKITAASDTIALTIALG